MARKNKSNNNQNGNSYQRGAGANSMANGSMRSKITQERKALNTYFTFNRKVGNRFNIHPQVNKYGTPGILQLYYTPSFGFNNDAESEIQNAVNDIYKFVRSYQTASADYTAPDLMMYILAAEQIFAWVAFLARGFNTLQFAAYDNRYVPRVLNQACGFDYDDLKDKRTQLADHINYIVQTMCDYALPKQCAFSLRHEWMNHNVFMDAPNSTAQLYVLMPRTFLKLVENVDASNVVTYSLEEISNPRTVASNYIYKGKGLFDRAYGRTQSSSTNPYQVPYGQIRVPLLTYEDIKKVTHQMLSPFILMHMQDISGDIRHAFGTDNLRTWTPLMMGSDWSPIYDENALLQINNMTMVGYLDPDYTKLTENTTGEILLSNPCLLAGTGLSDPLYGKIVNTEGQQYGPLNILTGARILNMTTPEPNPDEKLLATRWMNILSYGPALLYPDTPKYRVTTAATEIFEFGMLWIYDYAAGQAIDSIIRRVGPIFSAETPDISVNTSIPPTSTTDAFNTQLRTLVDILSKWNQKLDWLDSFASHPIIYKSEQIIDNNNLGEWMGGEISYQFDINNWTPITHDDLAHLTNVDLSMAFIIS